MSDVDEVIATLDRIASAPGPGLDEVFNTLETVRVEAELKEGYIKGVVLAKYIYRGVAHRAAVFVPMYMSPDNLVTSIVRYAKLFKKAETMLSFISAFENVKENMIIHINPAEILVFGEIPAVERYTEDDMLFVAPPYGVMPNRGVVYRDFRFEPPLEHFFELRLCCRAVINLDRGVIEKLVPAYADVDDDDFD